MIRHRPLRRLEDSLSPAAAVSLWLDEARSFGSLGAYLGWLIEQPPEIGPFGRIPSQVRSELEARLRGGRRADIEQSIKSAIRDALFRVLLVFELNIWASDALRLQSRECEVLLLLVNLELGHDGGTVGGPWPDGDGSKSQALLRRRLTTGAADLAIELFAAAEARETLEGAYLGGSAALFPDLAEAIERLTADVLSVLDVADGLAPVAPDGQPDGSADLESAVLGEAAHVRASHEASARLQAARRTSFAVFGDRREASRLTIMSLLRPAQDRRAAETRTAARGEGHGQTNEG